ncbi:VOC family protein [Rhizobium sp. FY34]|uniref:VOC family protein n=1 Tax=Rhizobium sp. FY34 TaxID=2562309 RepID=UPI0010BFB209|nr:VOC family protein [Rhizobium sp. FY34]
MSQTQLHGTGLPGLVGQDHIGLTVPDLDQALDFFVNVLGCGHAYSFGPIRDPDGDFMTAALGVHPRAEIRRAALVRIGFGSNVELFEYAAPDQQRFQPKNSDIGAFHLALYVTDIDAAKAYLESHQIACRLGPIPIGEGPNAGQSILYFQAPWGLDMELISYPGGMAYEKTATTILWNPNKPSA